MACLLGLDWGLRDRESPVAWAAGPSPGRRAVVPGGPKAEGGSCHRGIDIYRPAQELPLYHSGFLSGTCPPRAGTPSGSSAGPTPVEGRAQGGHPEWAEPGRSSVQALGVQPQGLRGQHRGVNQTTGLTSASSSIEWGLQSPLICSENS